MFAPVLQEWIEIKRERGRLIDATRPLYDVLADEYAQGMTSARITTIFNDVKHDLAPFLLHLKQHGKRPDVNCLQGNFNVKAQEALGREIASAMGFDFTKGRLDTSVHPCTFGIHSSDVRITTRYKADDVMEALTGTVHEVGHALYEQGLNAEHDGLLVDAPCGMAVHESQSLLWERMVMLGLPFARFLLPKLQSAFPESGFGRVGVQDLYRASNAIVDQSFIRVEADEVILFVRCRPSSSSRPPQVHYPLHVVLRFEIERDLLSGSSHPALTFAPKHAHSTFANLHISGACSVSEVPKIWREKMQAYLGCTPPDDARGCLQDVHWSSGAFGYFPT